MLLRPLPFVLMAVVFLLAATQGVRAWPQGITQHELVAELAAPARAADAWRDTKKSFLRRLLSFGEEKKKKCYEKDRGVIAQHIAVDIVSSALERECLPSLALSTQSSFMSALAPLFSLWAGQLSVPFAIALFCGRNGSKFEKRRQGRGNGLD